MEQFLKLDELVDGKIYTTSGSHFHITKACFAEFLYFFRKFAEEVGFTHRLSKIFLDITLAFGISQEDTLKWSDAIVEQTLLANSDRGGEKFAYKQLQVDNK